MWFKATGIIKYDPPRGKMKRKTDWWCVLNTDNEICRYYRWWVQNRYWIKLNQPSWGAHVSIVRGEKPEPHLMHLWKKYNGHKVEFEYSHNVRQSGDTTGWDRPDNYWFVDVRSDFLLNIREELNRPTHWNLHLTVGRTN